MSETAMGHSVKDFGAIGDGISDDTSSIQDAVNVGQSFMPDGIYRVTSTIVIPSGSGLTGISRSQNSALKKSILSADGVAGPILETSSGSSEGLSAGDQIIGWMQIKNDGSADSALHVKGPNVTVSTIQLASTGPFINGFVFDNCFGSYLVNLATNGSGITGDCFQCNRDFIANFCAQWYTSNVCNNAVLVQDCQGSVFSMMSLQVADVGLNLQNVYGCTFQGVYTENVALPISLGRHITNNRRVRNCSFNGCELGGANSSHRKYAERGALVHLYKAERVKFNNIWFGSYFPYSEVLPPYDGLYYENVEAITLEVTGFPETTNHEPQNMETLLKRMTTASSNSGITLIDTSQDNASKFLMKAQGGSSLHYNVQVDITGNLVTSAFEPDFACTPTTGRFCQKQYAEANTYEVNDFIYVGDAYNGNNVYRCMMSGTSGIGTPPTGTSNGQQDGSVVWDFHGKLL